MNHSFNTTIAELYGLQEAILLENIYFWCKKNEANNKLTEGRPWTYNTVKAFNTQFKYLTPAVITRALKNLEKAGLVDVGEFNNNAYDHTKWYCITDKCRAYFEESSKPKEEPETPSENSESNCDFSKSKNEDRNSITKKEQILITDIITDDKPNINSDIPSPQLSDHSYKPFVPQEENSKSHSVRQADRKTKKKTSKTDKPSFPQEYYTQCYNAYFANWKTLFEKNILSVEKPVFNYRENQSILYNAFIKYGFEDVLKAIKESINHHWLVNDKHYKFSCIFGPSELPDLINKTYDNSYGSKQPRSYQQPRQFDENHLFF